MRRPVICFVVGARPNFVKAAPVVAEALRRDSVDVRLVHAEQHYDAAMSAVFSRDLGLPEPDAWLGVRSGTHARQTADVMTRFEGWLLAQDVPPSVVVVFGDVNATLAAALAAAKLGIPVAHVESGLRSRDRSMPEEINRVLTDHLCDLLFVTEASGVENLAREGIAGESVRLVGNTMIDSHYAALPVVRPRAGDLLAKLGVGEREYGVLTMHRPSNVDDEARLRGLMAALGTVAERLPLIFPVHPRTARTLGEPPQGLVVVDPMGYYDFVALMASARLVLTDSGGIQEETTALGVPCVTIRDNTERPVTVSHGTNVLAGTDPERVRACALEALERPAVARDPVPLWDGRAAERILDVLERFVTR